MVTRDYYGRDGSYRGNKVLDGDIAKYYDAQGRYKGYRDYKTGKFFGARGEYKGKSERSGNITKFFDAKGSFKGYRDNTSGKRFGARGEYKGHRGADGKFYGARGEYRGHSVVRGGGSKKGGGISGFFKALFGSH